MILASFPPIWMVPLINWVLTNPAWSVGILMAPAALAGFAGVRPRTRAVYRWALALISVAGILVYARLAAIYCWAPQFWDHVEPQIASVSCLLMRGQSVYQSPAAADQYSMVYGPFSYIWVAGYYAFLGPSIFAAKLSGFVSGLAGAALLLAALKRSGNWWIALPCTALATTVYYKCELESIWCRPDSHEVFLVSLSVLALTLTNPWIAAVLVGISAGVCVNLKITAAAYFVPIATAFVLRYRRPGAAALGAALAAVALGAPFLFAEFPLADYLAWLRQASHHHVSAVEVGNVFDFAGWMAGILLILAVPSIWSKRHADPRATRQWCWTAGALGAAIILSLPVAIKKGAGTHHLMPLVPVLVWLVARAWSIPNSSGPSEATPRLGMRHWLAAPVVVVAMIYSPFASDVLARRIWISEPWYRNVNSDLAAIEKLLPGRTIEMGVGSDQTYWITYARPVLVFAGNPYHLDPAAAMDSSEDQNGLPAATSDLCREGLSDYVLIPAYDVPFSLKNWYREGSRVFSPQFVRAFHENYRLQFRAKFFDGYARKAIFSAHAPVATRR